GIPEETAALLKPWALYSTFSNSALAGNSKNDQNVIGLGIDMAFLTNAYVNQKQVFAIEGLVKQGMIFDSFSKELQEYLLNVYSDAALDVINGTADEDTMDMNEYTDLLLQYWHDGNTEDCKALLNQEDDAFDGELSKEEKVLMEEFIDKLMTQRDKGMADNIESLLKSEGSNTYFVVVGAAHYIGDKSVISILEKKGYVITRME
ncbi:MAG: TraB/GumN family protein, partial [Mobilitalea sp.]